MKYPNPKFQGMSQMTPVEIAQALSNYYAPQKNGIKPGINTADLIDFCMNEYRAWGDAVLMSAGSFLGIGKFPNEISAAKDYVKHEVLNYLNGVPFASQVEYDEWHKRICLELSDSNKFFKNYSDARRNSQDNYKNKSGFTVGNAQKFLNMLMKDLYACLSQGSTSMDNYEDYFTYCHMPLDSHILQFVDDIRYREKKGKRVRKYTWSQLSSYDSYMDEQYDIRNYVATRPGVTVLQTEFVVWPLYP